MSDEIVNKLGSFLKDWLPIIITTGGLIVGYFVFKAETRHQFDLQKVELVSLRDEVKTLRNQIEENRKDWQKNIESEIRSLREEAIRRDFRIRSLESKSGNASPAPSTGAGGFTPTASSSPTPEVEP